MGAVEPEVAAKLQDIIRRLEDGVAEGIVNIAAVELWLFEHLHRDTVSAPAKPVQVSPEIGMDAADFEYSTAMSRWVAEAQSPKTQDVVQAYTRWLRRKESSV